MSEKPVGPGSVIGFILLCVFLFVVVIMGAAFGLKAYGRYQKRADANNQVKVTAIQIRNQEQRVQIAQQKAAIRVQDAIGIREAQDKIQATLTPLYVQFEAFKALEAIAESGQNNSVIFVPTNPASGLPVVPGLTENVGK